MDYKNLKALRQAKHLSQHQVAKKLNMVASAYGKIERGQTHLTVERLDQIAKIFGVPDPLKELKQKLEYVAILMDMEITNAGIDPFSGPLPYEQLTPEDFSFIYKRRLTKEEYYRQNYYPIPTDQEAIKKQFYKLMEHECLRSFFELGLIEDEDLKELWTEYKKSPRIFFVE